MKPTTICTVAVVILLTGSLHAADWPAWGRDNSRNMYSPDAKGLPSDWYPGERSIGGAPAGGTTKNVRWRAKLGSQSYGNATIANGRVFVGTNNDSPRDPRFKGDHSLVYCLDEKTGKLIWQFTAPKIGSGKVGDWEFLGICSSPTVFGDRVYFVTNRFEVICCDVNGMANGNDGPFVDEGKYLVGLNTNKPPLAVSKTDADIIWRFDMRDELGIFVHNVTSSSVLIAGDYIYASTSNGVDWGHTNIPNPRAPSLICLDRKTGKLAGEEVSGMSTRVLHGGWTSPAYGVVDGEGYVFFAGPDGYLYCFDAEPIADPADPEVKILKERWRYDGNPRSYRWDEDGNPRKYVHRLGPSEFIATPVFHDGMVYVAIGQDPEHGDGRGNLSCIDVKAAFAAMAERKVTPADFARPVEKDTPHPMDVTREATRWTFDKIGRSISTAAVADGRLYIAELAGFVRCLDAETGELKWTHDTLSRIWGSTLVADGKVYIGTDDGMIYVFRHSEKLELLAEVEMPGQVLSSAISANGAVYFMTGTELYAVASDPLTP